MIRWLESPIFSEDEEKTRRARLLNAIAIVITIFMAFFLPIILFNKTIPVFTKYVDFLILIVALSMRYGLSRGKVREVSFGFIVSGFILITFAILSLGTIQTPTTATFLFMVVTSGMLFDYKGIIYSTIASSLIVGGCILAFSAGMFPQQVSRVDFVTLILYVLIFASIGALTNFSLKATMNALQRSKEEINERKRAEDGLRASEARFRNLFEQTHDAVIIIDLEGNFLEVNQRAGEMLGYSMDEMRSLSIEDISVQMEQNRAVFSRLLAGELIPHQESSFRKKDGTILPVEIYLELVKNHDGTPLYVQSVARDISQRKQSEEAIKLVNEQLNRRIAQVEHLSKELKEQAIRDPLTGLYNRRYLSEALQRELARIVRAKGSISIIITDIDHFKSINDTYGHQAGDALLVEIAHMMRNLTRSSDIICRYGGEEFVIVMINATIEDAEKRAEAIRLAIEMSVVRYKEWMLKTTISLGVAAYPDHGKEAEEIVVKADKALYQSKHSGRNRVTVWGEEDIS